MEIERLTVFGNVNIGVYIFANDDYAFIPPGLPEQKKRVIERVLKVNLVEVKVARTHIIGALVSGNNHAVLLPRIAEDDEVERIRSEVDIPVVVTRFRHTALGNLILANDNGAIVYPEFDSTTVQELASYLGVPRPRTAAASIAGIPTVGSVAVVNNRGGLVHTDASPQELGMVRRLLEVKVETGTVNLGISFIRTGMVANNKGVLIGELTTGPELVRIEAAFGEGADGEGQGVPGRGEDAAQP